MRPEMELRAQRRLAMTGVTERLGMSFASGNIEMRAKPNGTPTGSSFEWNGYAAVYDFDFPMWDPNGEPYTESVAYGASKRSLGNPNLDVPFLIGHNDAGIPLARTKSGTMRLSEDTRGLHTNVPAMDGRREEVRALASAVERGDLDEMSLAFVCTRQAWSPDWERRTILEWDLHRGDVCAVVHGANVGTAGAWMAPVEQLSFRRPAAIGGPHPPELRAMSLPAQHGHPGQSCWDPDGDGDCDLTAAADTDHDYWAADGTQLQPVPGHPMPAQELSAARAFEVLASVSQAERDKAHAAGNSLPDKSYPINNVAQLHSAAVLAASHHGDWKAAQVLIRRRAKELGVDVTTLPGFGEEKAASGPYELRAAHEPFTGTHSHPHPAMGAQGGDATHDHEHSHDGNADHGHHAGEHAAGLPLERRASAGEDLDVATASDYDAAAAPHPLGGTDDDGTPWECAPHTHYSNAGTSAIVTVDGSTGIPGDEVQMAAARRHETRMRELELEELAAARVPSRV